MKLAEKYLEYMRSRRFSESHIISTKGRLRKWILPYFGVNKIVTEIKKNQVEDFLKWRRHQSNQDGKYPTDREIQITLTTFNRAIDGFLGSNYLRANPCDTVKVVVPNIRKRRALTPEEVDKILQYKGWLRPVLMFLVDTGCRFRECLDLTWDQVDLKQRYFDGEPVPGVVYIYASKTNNERTIPLTDRLYEMLRSAVPFLTEPWVFIQLTGNKRYKAGRAARVVRKELVTRVIPQTGVNFTFHELRHTFITRLVSQGVDIASVKYLAGHKKISTTQVYLHEVSGNIAHAIRKINEMQ